MSNVARNTNRPATALNTDDLERIVRLWTARHPNGVNRTAIRVPRGYAEFDAITIDRGPDGHVRWDAAPRITRWDAKTRRHEPDMLTIEDERAITSALRSALLTRAHDKRTGF